MLTTSSHRARTALAGLVLALSLTACSSDKPQKTVEALERGGDVAKIKALVTENIANHVEAAGKVAAKVAPLFAGEEPPSEDALRSALAGVVKPPEVIQALVFSPVDLMVVVDAEGRVLARDRESEERSFRGRDLFEESAELRAAFAEGEPTQALGPLGRGDQAVPYLYFIAPIMREGERVAAVVLGYGLWKEGRRITLQMRRETEQGDDRVLIVWAFAYLGDEFYKLPNSPLEVEQAVPDAATRRAQLEKSPEGYVVPGRIFKRDVAVAVLPFPDIGEDFGIIYMR